MSFGNSRSMNPIVPLDWRDLLPSKNYGHLRGWSTPVDLGYDIINKVKIVRGRRQR
jgi:hypothetical protein